MRVTTNPAYFIILNLFLHRSVALSRWPTKKSLKFYLIDPKSRFKKIQTNIRVFIIEIKIFAVRHPALAKTFWPKAIELELSDNIRKTLAFLTNRIITVARE